MRHTTFRLALAPTPAQAALLVRHAGASRLAYNQSLRLVTDALVARRADPQVRVPWSGFDLINAFSTWKRGENAGRVFVVAPDGTTTKQVFEEAAVGLGRALAAYAEAKGGRRKGRVGSPGTSVRAAVATASGSATRPTASGSVTVILAR